MLDDSHIHEAVFLNAGDQRVDHTLEQLAIDRQRTAFKAERYAGKHAHAIGRRGRSGLALDALDQIGVRYRAQRNHDRNIAWQRIDFRKGEIFVADDVSHDSPQRAEASSGSPR